MNRPELRKELRRRFPHRKALPFNTNQSALKFRLFLIALDLKEGINPYRNSSSESSDEQTREPQRS